MTAETKRTFRDEHPLVRALYEWRASWLTAFWIIWCVWGFTLADDHGFFIATLVAGYSLRTSLTHRDR